MIVQVKLIGKFQTFSHATSSIRLDAAEELSFKFSAIKYSKILRVMIEALAAYIPLLCTLLP